MPLCEGLLLDSLYVDVEVVADISSEVGTNLQLGSTFYERVTNVLTHVGNSG